MLVYEMGVMGNPISSSDLLAFAVGCALMLQPQTASFGTGLG